MFETAKTLKNWQYKPSNPKTAVKIAGNHHNLYKQTTSIKG